MPLSTTLALVAAALFAGIVDAIAGGGGLITVPALLATGLPPHLALGTNKGQSVFGSGAALAAFWRAGRVDRRQALYAFPLGLLGSACGAALVSAISPAALRPIVIGMLIGAAALLLIRKPARADDAPDPHWGIAALLAFTIGAYDGFFGPGTGTFLIVGFVALCDRSLVHASADAKVVNFASNIAAVTVFSFHHAILWTVSLPMALGQLLGGIVGAHFAMRGGARVVRAMVLLVSGALIAKLVYDLVR
ncbi:MAG: TSUP family transporter [Deltaproteobacteria bacterium]|nr:TSUP family transporter [Deltaproteobacteria bacterium]